MLFQFSTYVWLSHCKYHVAFALLLKAGISRCQSPHFYHIFAFLNIKAFNVYLTRSRDRDTLFQIKRSPPVYDITVLLLQLSIITPQVSSFVWKNFVGKEVTLLSNILKHANYPRQYLNLFRTFVSHSLSFLSVSTDHKNTELLNTLSLRS